MEQNTTNDIQVVRLDCGATVIMYEMDTPLAFGEFGFKVGSFCEDPDCYGISHLLEHLAFEANPKRSSREFQLQLRSLGASANAGTSYVSTAYHFTVLRENLVSTLSLFLNQVGSFKVDEKTLEKEKGIVCQEIDVYADDNWSIVMNALFAESLQRHPINHPIIGFKDVVNAATVQQVQQYFEKYYTTDNMVVILVGKNLQDVLKPLEDSLTENFARGPEFNIFVGTPANVEIFSKAYRCYKPGITQHFIITGSIYEFKYRFCIYILIHILGRGLGSYFYNEFREERNITYFVRATCFCLDREYLLLVYQTSLSEEKDIATALSIFKSGYDHMLEMMEDEFLSAKNSFILNEERSFQQVEGIGDTLLDNFCYQQELPLNLREELEGVKNVSFEDFKKFLEDTKDRQEEMFYAILSPEK